MRRLLLGCAALRLLLLPLLLLPVLVLAGCSDDPTPAERRDALAEELAGDLVAETDGAIDEDQARCVADALVDAVGIDRFDEIVAATTTAGGDDEDQLRQEVIDAFAGCDALGPVLDGADGGGD